GKRAQLTRPTPKKTTPETVEVVSKVMEMLTVLVKTAPAEYQLHLAAVTLNVLIGVLRDPTFEVELSGPVLVNIKSVMECLEKSASTEQLDPKFMELIFNGAIGSLLTSQVAFAPGKAIEPTVAATETLDFVLGDPKVGRRDAKAAAPEDQEVDASPVDITRWCNGLLGAMLIMTNCARVEVLPKFMNLFGRMIMSSIESNVAKIVTVGYQCLKSIILIESTTTSLTMPGTESDASTTARTVVKDDKVGMQVLEEGIQTLRSLATASSEEARSGVIAIIMSTVVPLLHDVNNKNEMASGSKAAQVHALALNHLLGLGTQFPKEFRQGLAYLSVERRTRLETAIRQSVLEQQEEQKKQQEREQREQERLARERDRVKIQLTSSFSGFT
ncbi:hypothetical protein BGW38_001584, partial [Lunasporangiospora selenospora]